MKNMRNRGLKEDSFQHKILIGIGEFFEDVFKDGIVPILTLDFKTIREIAGISSYSDERPFYYKASKSIYSLKKRNYIKITEKRGQRKIELTQKGKEEMIKYKIKLKIKKPKWNGKWFGISWDIPEASKKDRNYLRKQLKWLGFKELQKSIWVFPFDIREEIKELIKFCKEDLMGDIRFLTIEKLESDKDIKKYFKSILS